ncbi:MAG: hypothetical protein Ct9H300mP28_37310 [Pseudomonadota bacterium]|nr:MAG: hypothetical protein Ct9H300mP28_37310 [Pseudomonadota bacterium]
MLNFGTWTALLLYIIKGNTGIYVSAFEEASKARILKWTWVSGMRKAWCIQH